MAVHIFFVDEVNFKICASKGIVGLPKTDSIDYVKKRTEFEHKPIKLVQYKFNDNGFDLEQITIE